MADFHPVGASPDGAMKPDLPYDHVFEALRDPLVLVDGDGNVQGANAAARALSGPAGLERITDLTGLALDARELLGLLGDPAYQPSPELRARVDVVDVPGPSPLKLLHVRPRTDDFWRDEMIAMVSHEIKNPLSAMKHSVDILLSQVPGELTDGQRRFLDTSGRSIDRLTHLLDGFLDVSRIRSGTFAVERQRVNVHAFVADVLESFRTLFNVRRVDLSLSVAESCGWAWIDAAKLEQVLLNLLSNALKFTPENGSITVEAGTSGIEVLDDDLRLLPWDELGYPRILEISVRDTGLGMTSEALAAIYHRFRGPGAGRGAGGAHLGLNISRTLTEALGGWMDVHSTPGIGTTAAVHVPQDRATTAIVERARSLDATLRAGLAAHHPVSLFVLGKYGDDDWTDIASTWVTPPAVNPEEMDEPEDAFVLWTLNGSLAVVISRGTSEIDALFGSRAVSCDDSAYVFNGYAVGAARAPEDASTTPQLFNIATTRMARARSALAYATIESLDSRLDYVTQARESLKPPER